MTKTNGQVAGNESSVTTWMRTNFGVKEEEKVWLEDNYVGDCIQLVILIQYERG